MWCPQVCAGPSLSLTQNLALCCADQKPVPKNFVGRTIQIVSELESTIQIPVIVSLKAHTATIYLNSRQPGVLLRNNGTCYDNAKRGGVKECPYVLQWKSGCGSTGGGSPSSEDIQKYECLDAVAPISGQLNCEYSLCRYGHLVAAAVGARATVEPEFRGWGPLTTHASIMRVACFSALS